MNSIETTKGPFEETIRTGPYPIRFPKKGELDQDEEWCEVDIGGKWKRVRFHDYDEIYTIPGLYETVFYRTLRCVSPTKVVELFSSVIMERKINVGTLSALDFGAGNGMAGEALQVAGVRKIVGLDILEDAKAAAQRDRPWVYNDYVVTDLGNPSADVYQRLKNCHFNLLVTVAALGYGDIPVRAFFNAFNLIQDNGWIALNIKEEFLSSESVTGFAGLINRMFAAGLLQCEQYKRYRHRLNIRGEELFYIAMVAKKIGDIPPDMVEV